ncbi:sigma-54-dependent Fis family transcriptional regulator [Desulfovibrionales bacterium]
MPDQLPFRNETNELRLLFEVGRALDGASELGDQLETTLELMARYTGMMRGTLLLVDESTAEITAEASYGLSDAERQRARYKIGEGVTGRVIQTGTPVIVPNISEDPLFLNRTGARDIQKENISFVCVPILVNGKAVGALSADSLFAESVCLEEDMRLLQILASLIARAVQIRREFKAMHSAVVEENRRLQDIVRISFRPVGMVGSSPAFRQVMLEVARVSSSGATVLLRGESGTGKELVANTIHANSPRAGKPFIKINCAALPENLVESELFGHERGAFTGAVGVRKGRFEMAHGGTLFLDEIGDMPLATQAKLLRVLQEREFERVGGETTLQVDVRLLAATNQDLEAMVKSGTFREDLYYRISVFPIMLPPLRERQEDIMTLAIRFVEKMSERHGRKGIRIPAEAADVLMSYSWPGNIRELENVIERAVLLCENGGEIGAAQLSAWLHTSPSVVPDGQMHTWVPSKAVSLHDALHAVEKRMIEESLKCAGGNMAKAAACLGISERIMGLRMKKYDLKYRLFRKKE